MYSSMLGTGNQASLETSRCIVECRDLSARAFLRCRGMKADDPIDSGSSTSPGNPISSDGGSGQGGRLLFPIPWLSAGS